MIKSIAGTGARLAALQEHRHSLANQLRGRAWQPADRMLAGSLRKAETRRSGRRRNHPEPMRIPAAKWSN